MAEAVFQITELRRTGAGVIDTPVSFRWTGGTHSAPVGELPLTLQLRTIREEVPGAIAVVEQVVSGSWQPFSLRGEWNDKWAGSGFAVATFEAFSAMVARAPLVRVDFEAIKLVGLLTQLSVSYRRAAVIGWQATLSPHQLGDGPARVLRAPIATRSMRSHYDDAAAARDAMVAQRNRLLAVPSKARGLLAQIDGKIGAISDKIAQARFEVEDGLAKVQNATASLQRLASTFRAVRDTAHALALSLVSARSDLVVAYDSALQTLAFNEWSFGTREIASQAIFGAVAAERDARTLARAKPRAIYRPYEGETLYQISERYYGTADGWRRIYQANGLTGLRLTGEEQLLIPEVSA